MSVKKRKTYLILAIVALSAMTGAAFWHFYPQARDKAEEAILEQALSGQDDLANIVFKAFSLTQGESGLEAWRLKAEVASVRKDSGIIHVEKPKITYFTRPDNQEVQVSAEYGVVDQGERNMELWPNVVVVKDNNTLKTTKLIYRGAEHSLFFPEELIVESENMLARADEAVWRLDTNVFEAWGGVAIHFKATPKEENEAGDVAPAAANATAPAPAAE